MVTIMATFALLLKSFVANMLSCKARLKNKINVYALLCVP